LHFPDNGSEVLLGATSSNEEGCIELDFVSPYLIRVKSMTFFSFNHDLDWNYFRIENENLQPSGACSTVKSHPNYDHLVELTPTVYIDGKYWDEMEFGSEGLPDTARQLSRILKGDLVIFKDTSVYNQISDSDDGRHARMSSEEFKSYMTDMYNAFH
jgi:serine/threonine-protein kinase